MSSRAARFVVPAVVLAVAMVVGCTGEQQTTQVTGEPFGYCGHRIIPWSEPDCPDTSIAFMSMQDVESMQLTVRTNTGVQRTVTIPATTDVIFLSKMSVDSILIPYYQGRNGTAQVQLLRNRMQRP